MYLPRHLAIPLHRAVQAGGPVLVQGPRGAGKTTLLRKEFPGHLYIDLSEIGPREEARRDPSGFLRRLRREAILDEAHRVPELIAHLEQPGEQAALLLASPMRTETRLPRFTLYPPTGAELRRRPALPLRVLGRFEAKDAGGIAVPGWERSETFLDRDVSSLVRVHERDRFERFLAKARERGGMVLDLQELARDAEVAHRTAVRWMAALETCFEALLLRPLDESFGRRRARRPKLHTLGTRGNRDSTVFWELYRNACHEGADAEFRYWRDSNGFEVPLVIVDAEGGMLPVGHDEQSVARWIKLAGVPAGAVIVEPNAGKSAAKMSTVRHYWLSHL
jgi:uncharacterized protein